MRFYCISADMNSGVLEEKCTIWIRSGIGLNVQTIENYSVTFPYAVVYALSINRACPHNCVTNKNILSHLLKSK